VLGEQALRGLQHALPVARRVGALGRPLTDDGQR
jgi:hypothetical protein